MPLFNFILDKLPELGQKLIEQIYLVGASLIIALCISVPLGILLTKKPRFKNFFLSICGILWTIPSLALFAFFIPLFGIGMKPAILVLSLYSVLPILRGTIIGIGGVSPKIEEAAIALGLTSTQQLIHVKLPLALPVIISGVRTATTLNVGIATLAAFIGAGGLGDFINQGIALNNTDLLLLGAIPAALLALSLDYINGQVERWCQKPYFIFPRKKRWLINCAFVGVLLFAFFSEVFFLNHKGPQEIHIGSKNFTEQFILAEIMSQLIEKNTSLKVVRNFNLGTTAITHNALIKGAIDIYPEYTGTAYLTVLNHADFLNKLKVYDLVKNEYAEKFNLIWLTPFGFTNTQAILVNNKFAKKYHLNNISDVKFIKQGLRIGVAPEFLLRSDGFLGLKKTYNLNFQIIKQMNISLLYEALAHDKVDAISAFATDPKIALLHLKQLKDDKNFYPNYLAAPVIRQETLVKYPEITLALAPVLGKISAEDIKRLNYQVEVLNKSLNQVVAYYLQTKFNLKPSATQQ